ELALHRAHHDRHMNENLKWLATAVRCIGEGIMTTDRDGRITCMNPAAEDIVGWNQREAIGVSLATVIGFGPEGNLREMESPATKAMNEAHLVRITGSVLPSKTEARRHIVGSVAPILDDLGMVIGSVLAFHKHQETLQCGPHETPTGEGGEQEGRLGAPQGIVNLCAWCKRVPDKSGEWYDLETFVTERSSLQFNGGLCPECMSKCFPENGIL
ncbi:MAG: PAS domain-containing protein, partial [Nitrospiraceae bacterium]